MQVSVIELAGLEKKLEITLPLDKVKKAYQQELNKLAKQSMNGFRRHKIPKYLLESRYGDAVKESVLNEAVREGLLKAIEEQSLDPVQTPKIELTQKDFNQPITFSAVFEVYPDIDFSPFSELQIEKMTTKIEVKVVEKRIKQIKDHYAKHELKKEKGQIIDETSVVSLTYEATADGKTFENGKAEEQQVDLAMPFPFKGMGKALKGKKVGDDFSTELQLSEHFSPKSMANRQVKVSGKIEGIFIKEPVVLDENIIKSYGVKEGTLAALREKIRSDIEKEANHVIEAKMHEEIMQALLKTYQLDRPAYLIESQLESLKESHKDDNQPLDEKALQKEAEAQVDRGLLLRALIKKESLKPDAERVKQYLMGIAMRSPNPKETLQWLYGNEDMQAQVESMVLEKQAMELIAKQVTPILKAVDFETLMGPGSEVSSDSSTSGSDA